MKMYLFVLFLSVFISSNVSCMFGPFPGYQNDWQEPGCYLAKEPDCLEEFLDFEDYVYKEIRDKLHQDLSDIIDAKAKFMAMRVSACGYYSEIAPHDSIGFIEEELKKQLKVIDGLCFRFLTILEHNEAYKCELLDMLNEKVGESGRCYFQEIQDSLPGFFAIKLQDILKTAIGRSRSGGPSHRKDQRNNQSNSW